MASIALSSLPGGSNSAAFAPGDLKKMKDGFMSCGGDRGTKADWSFYNRGLSEEVIKWETTDFSYHSD